jgi:hypothetical protein
VSDNVRRGYNRTFIQTQQNNANDLLWARGYVYLNEVYDMLGFDRIPDGEKIGWFDRDSHISFDIFVTETDLGKQFFNGEKDYVWIHFNVDETKRW